MDLRGPLPFRNANGNDDGVTMLRAINEGIAALNRNVQNGLAALVNPALNSAFVDAGSVTNVATIDINLPENVALCEVFLWSFTPVTDGDALYLRALNGTTVFSGASDYSWANLKAATHANDAADAQIVIGSGFDNVLSDHLYLRIIRPRVATARKFITWSGLIMDSAASMPMTLSGGARVENATLTAGEVTAVRLFFNGGNFASASWAVKYNSYTAT